MVRKVLDISKPVSIIRSQADLELLVSWWSIETHTFITSWDEFTPTLKDVQVMFRLPVFTVKGVTCLVLS